jgi:hypothetical protein
MEKKQEEKKPKMAPIIFTPEQWELLRPMRVKWVEPYTRLKAISEEKKKLEREEKYLRANADYAKAMFWDEVSRMYPHTEDIPLTFKGGSGEGETIAARGSDVAEGAPRVEQADMTDIDDLKDLLKAMPDSLKSKMPSHLKLMVGALGLED